MSDVEKFYNAIQKQMGGTRPFNTLHPMEIDQFCQAINIIIGLTRKEDDAS